LLQQQRLLQQRLEIDEGLGLKQRQAPALQGLDPERVGRRR
jgi:hypothetical protein